MDDFWVTLLDANHCPGACLLLFRLADGTRYLHTGKVSVLVHKFIMLKEE